MPEPRAASPPIPPLSPGSPALAILVDYDGTIALTDVSDTITGALLPADLERELAVLYDTGRGGSREIMQREIELLPPDPGLVNDIVAAQPHDQAFAPFVRLARAAGIPVEIVSDGFGFFIAPAMARLGVADLVTIATAETTFDDGRAQIAFPNGHPSCFVCGTCKRNRVLAHQAAGRAVLFIGDGESDRYAAGYADFVFAKRGLVRICEGLGWPFARWEQFDDVERWLSVRLQESVRDGAPILARRPTTYFCGPEVWGPGLTAPPAPFTVIGGETAPLGVPEVEAGGMIEWVVLDVGETLIDETRVWAAWARELGISPLTFGAALGAVIAGRRDHRSVFDLLGFPDWRRHGPAVEAAFGGFRAEDLYPDALPTVELLQAAGRRVAILANQPAARHQQLVALGFRPDVIAMSEEMGLAKPDPAFFARSLEMLGSPDPRRVAYVGDRVDNDVAASRHAGMRAVWMRRGPWGRLQEDLHGDAELVVWSLDELVRRLPELDGEPPARGA